jgi:hypothetical protein
MTTTHSHSKLPIPPALRSFFSRFPLHTYPAVKRSDSFVLSYDAADNTTVGTLWVVPPSALEGSALSADVECLKHQALAALLSYPTSQSTSKIVRIGLRYDIATEGGVNGHLPTLHVHQKPGESRLLGKGKISEWMLGNMRSGEGDASNWEDGLGAESATWIELLERDVRDALVHDIDVD